MSEDRMAKWREPDGFAKPQHERCPDGEAADAPTAEVSPEAVGEEQSSRAGATPAAGPQSYDAIIDEYIGPNDSFMNAFTDSLVHTIFRLRSAEVPEVALLAVMAAVISAHIMGALDNGQIDKRFAQALAREVAESAGLDDAKVLELCE